MRVSKAVSTLVLLMLVPVSYSPVVVAQLTDRMALVAFLPRRIVR